MPNYNARSKKDRRKEAKKDRRHIRKDAFFISIFCAISERNTILENGLMSFIYSMRCIWLQESEIWKKKIELHRTYRKLDITTIITYIWSYK